MLREQAESVKWYEKEKKKLLEESQLELEAKNEERHRVEHER